jgi:hypothetical protein
MTRKRKIVLGALSAVVVAGHAALFVGGGTWRRTGFALVVVDAVSGWFILAAMREFKKANGK